jgi:hypothetical protein
MPNLTGKDAHGQPFIAAISKKSSPAPRLLRPAKSMSTAPSAPQTVFVHSYNAPLTHNPPSQCSKIHSGYSKNGVFSLKPPGSEHPIPANGPPDAARAASNTALARRGTLRRRRKCLPFHSNSRDEKGLHNLAAFHYNTNLL